MLSLPEVEVSFGGHPLISGLTPKVRGQIGESKKICVSVIFCFHYYLFNQKNERRPMVSFFIITFVAFVARLRFIYQNLLDQLEKKMKETRHRICLIMKILTAIQ